MKKNGIIAILALCLLCAGCQFDYDGTGTGQLIEASAQEVMDWFDAKKTFVFFVGQTTCNSCEEYIEMLNSFMTKNALTMYYVEVDAPENTDTAETFLKNYIPEAQRTPTTYYVVRGEIKDSVVGALSEDELIDWLEANHINLPNGESGS